ncbi:MAG: hypothetical protein ACTII7_05145 [Galactobacter sp.]
MNHSLPLRRLHLGIAAAIGLALVGCSSPSPQAAVTVTETAPASSTPASSLAASEPATTDAATTSSAVAPSSTAPSSAAPQKPVTLQWTTIKRGEEGPGNYFENLEVPSLENASEEISKKFNAEVSRHVSQARSIANPSSLEGFEHCEYGCLLNMSKVQGEVFNDQFVSIMTVLYPYPGGGAHGHGIPMAVTMNIETGELASRDQFVTASATSVDPALQRALAAKGVSGAENASIDTDGVAWAVSSKGVTFEVTHDMLGGPEADDVQWAIVPWSDLQK